MTDRPRTLDAASIGAYLDTDPYITTNPGGGPSAVMADMVALIERGGLSADWVRIVKNGVAGDLDVVAADVVVAGRKTRLVRHDAIERIGEAQLSLAISGIERLTATGAQMCAEKSLRLGGVFDLNAYITPAWSRGFDLHYDPQDVYLCQLEGHKTWELFRPDYVFPGPGDYAIGRYISFGAMPDMAVTLRPDEVLYIPRGWGHRGTTTEAASTHLTLGHDVENVAMRLLGVSVSDVVDDGNPRSDLRRNAWALTQDELERIHSVINLSSGAAEVDETHGSLTPGEVDTS